MLKKITSIPKHVALIMDGNRRWAKKRSYKIFKGHSIGEERIEPIIDSAIDLGITYLTFWAFSTENWKRSKKEVDFLLKLFRKKLNDKIERFYKKNVQINVIGNLKMFPPGLQKKTKEWIERTKNNNKIIVNFALSYGGRDEIVRAINKWSHNSNIKNNKSKISKQELEKYLDTAGQPNPDLLIRTGGEKRLSGFMLWQLEYAELYFTDTLWPDFSSDEFLKALEDYSSRKRRFGK